MTERTREEELESWVGELLGLCYWLERLIPEDKAYDARGVARCKLQAEQILEKNPNYLRGKQDRLAGLDATSKDRAYQNGYWHGHYGYEVDAKLPPPRQAPGLYDAENEQNRINMERGKHTRFYKNGYADAQAGRAMKDSASHEMGYSWYLNGYEDGKSK